MLLLQISVRMTLTLPSQASLTYNGQLSNVHGWHFILCRLTPLSWFPNDCLSTQICL